MAVGRGWCAQQDVLGADAPGERTVARSVAALPGPDRLGLCPGTGPGCSYHRQMGHRLQRGRSGGPDLRAVRWFPPALREEQQAELQEAVQRTPATAGIALANWNWKVVRQFVSERFGVSLSRSTCLDYLHRLGFAFQRPKKRLLKADAGKRESFVAEYAAMASQAQESGERYSSLTRPISVPTPSCGASGCCGRAGLGGLDQPALRREGQLLFGGVLGDRRGGMDGTGGEQQLRNIGSFPGAVAGEAERSAERDLGQRAGALRRGGA